MPWVPTTDFEEEVVNLQPDHDFIYGVLSEPQHSYPRPKAHTEYAESKRLQKTQQRKEDETTGKINEKLRIIQQVQNMARTKPVGEQPSIDDWDDNQMIEQETVGLIRYCGMEVSVEQPLNPEVTLATHPVNNTIKVVQNGNRKVALFFDDNVFKMQDKMPNNSLSFETQVNKFENSKDDSLVSVSEADSSIIPSSSNSFDTNDEYVAVNYNSSSSRKLPSDKNIQSYYQYQKLMNDLSLMSLNSSNYSQDNDSFHTAEGSYFWEPVFEDEDIFSKKANWPSLPTKSTAADKNSLNNSNILDETRSDLANDICSEQNDIKKGARRKNFLDRFIKSEDADTSNSTPEVAPPEPTSYASITKHKVKSPKKHEGKKSEYSSFYTTRRMYALKRNAK